jgi:hypothetical protein
MTDRRDTKAMPVLGGVRRALGREPRDGAGSARDMAAIGVWGTQQ